MLVQLSTVFPSSFSNTRRVRLDSVARHSGQCEVTNGLPRISTAFSYKAASPESRPTVNSRRDELVVNYRRLTV